MKSSCEKQTGPDVWQICQVGLLLVVGYLVAVGPVVRMCARNQIPHSCMAIYRPVLQPTAPCFDLVRDYVSWWI